jgi:hypothetical protein
MRGLLPALGYGQKAVTRVSPVDIPPLLPVYPKDQRILQYTPSTAGQHRRAARSVGPVSLTLLERLQSEDT